MADETAGGGWLYLLGRIAWRLLQAVLVTAGVVLVFSLVMNTHSGGGKERAYIAMMKSDLRNLVTAQESYYYDYHAYAPSLEALGPQTYRASTGVTIVIDRGTAGGFAATATHNVTPYRCGIFIASAPHEPERLLSWSAGAGERHDLFRVDYDTWLEKWPGHTANFRVARSIVALGSTGALINKLDYTSVQLFVRDRGQPLDRILWREHDGPWQTLGTIIPGSEPVPSRDTAQAATPGMAPPWPGAREGAPLCWKP